jgi:hypothetical protein
MTPFGDIVAAQTSLGKPIAMGTNTALVLLIIGLSEISYSLRRVFLSQAMAVLAVVILPVSVIGYLEGPQNFTVPWHQSP